MLKNLQVSKFSLPMHTVLMLGLLAACGGQEKPNIEKSVRTETVEVKAPPAEVVAGLQKIEESVPTSNVQVWMNKEFWIDRSIWISLGVERSSITGLAMSVDGYHAAKVTRSGDYLLLSKDSKGLFGGTVLAPDMPINAYPIVKETETEFLIDFSAPKTPYGLTTLGVTSGSDSSSELLPRFEYVKSVNATENSLSYTVVSTAKSNKRLYDEDSTDAEAKVKQDPYLINLTLRVDWILPIEDDKYQALEEVPGLFGFFLTDPRMDSQGTNAKKYVQKIATHKPFNWVLSSNTPVEYRNAIAQGITGWNSSLGGDNVLKVTVSDKAVDSVTDPTVSNLVWDDNTSIGYAFANWRSHPFTGEIVQAQVYLSGAMWAETAREVYKLREIERQLREMLAEEAGSVNRDSNQVESAQKIEAALKSARNQLTQIKRNVEALDSLGENAQRSFVSFNSHLSAQKGSNGDYCFRPVELISRIENLNSAIDSALDEALKDLDRVTEAVRKPDEGSSERENPTHMPYVPAGMSEDTFAQYTVRAVVMHEVGHTLGLRHNFMGSLGTSKEGKVESASIMDYNDLVVDAQFEEPGDWDKALLALVYQGQVTDHLTEMKYCTDEQRIKGETIFCFAGDFSANPVKAFHVAEDINLEIAKLYLAFGAVPQALEHVTKALSSNVNKIRHAFLSLDTTAGDTSQFVFSQKEAWMALQESLKARDKGFPESFTTYYSGILTTLMAQASKPAALQSANGPELVEFYKQKILAVAPTDLAVRKISLKALHRFQTPYAQFAMMEAYAVLNAKMAAIQNPFALKPEEKLIYAQDQDILVNLKKILFEDSYFE